MKQQSYADYVPKKYAYLNAIFRNNDKWIQAK